LTAFLTFETHFPFGLSCALAPPRPGTIPKHYLGLFPHFRLKVSSLRLVPLFIFSVTCGPNLSFEKKPGRFAFGEPQAPIFSLIKEF